MTAATRITDLVSRTFGVEVPLQVRAWDGSVSGPLGGPTLVIGSRRALRRLLWQPGEMGMVRAYVSGDIDLEGDLLEALHLLVGLGQRIGRHPGLSVWDRLEMLRTAALLGAVGRQPPPPPEEVTLAGQRHSRERDRAAIQHHYDVSNEFYRLLLGPSMVYSCAYWDDGVRDLDQAQLAKLDLVARKLGLSPGMRLLDVGCGWGSMLIHAAAEYGVTGIGVTLSDDQAELARKRVAEAGLEQQIEIRLADYREVDDGPFDAISSIGMAEHVGRAQFLEYATRLHELVRPGGRVLNHQITQRPQIPQERRTFVSEYVFPDGELLPLSTVISALEEADLEVRDVENLREHYPKTLTVWLRNLENAWETGVGLAGDGRARVWRLYLAVSVLGFDLGRTRVNQVLAVRQHAGGRADMPATRRALLG